MSKYSYRIEYDQEAANPRDEFDHLSTFYGSSSRYIIGGKNDQNFNYREDLEKTIKEFKREKAVIVEFSNNAGMCLCYAVIERSQLKKEYLDHGYSMRKALLHARRCAQGEIAEFNAWAEGEVYGFIVENEDGEHLDSCWGFYGDDGRKLAEDEAKSIIKHYENSDAEEDRKLESRLKMAASL